MSNHKEINWDVIRAEYVMSNEYPSFDELCKKYEVSKPLMIAKANDRKDAINAGSTWIEQRKKFISKKRSSEEETAINESKKMIKGLIVELNNIGTKAFKLVSNDLDQMLISQQEAKDAGEHFPISKYIKLSDVAKIAESLHKLTGSGGAKEMILRLETGNKKKQLSDLSDDELNMIELQANTGQIIDQEIEDTEFEEVNE